jgi:hypothetical protein
MKVEPLIKRVGNNGTVVTTDKVICTVKIMQDVGYVAIITAFAHRKSNNKKKLYFLLSFVLLLNGLPGSVSRTKVELKIAGSSARKIR